MEFMKAGNACECFHPAVNEEKCSPFVDHKSQPCRIFNKQHSESMSPPAVNNMTTFYSKEIVDDEPPPPDTAPESSDNPLKDCGRGSTDGGWDLATHGGSSKDSHASSSLNEYVVRGIVVAPQGTDSSATRFDATLHEQTVQAEILNDSGWTELLLPRLLGLPLRFVKWPAPTSGAGYNHLVQILSIDVDVSKPVTRWASSGLGQTGFPSILGDVMLVREDGKPLAAELVQALARYVDTELKEIIRFGSGHWKNRTVGEVQCLADQMQGKVAPGAFANFCHEHAKTRVAAGDRSLHLVQRVVESEDVTEAELEDRICRRLRRI